MGKGLRPSAHDLQRTTPPNGPNGARHARYDAFPHDEEVGLKRGTEHLNTTMLKQGTTCWGQRESWDELTTSCANEASTKAQEQDQSSSADGPTPS
ncbi:hypothetical protein NPX13_g9870 [Xylaria arbuscula]|uniref:Uncharacterized protein n=1 Tax=Xylaria arbuscula TaxID=114810 RepID=A0A9W8N644_9PEZI|nr:hypothetical protein NPX13_g9870 [Xylaria arbuscula]